LSHQDDVDLPDLPEDLASRLADKPVAQQFFRLRLGIIELTKKMLEEGDELGPLTPEESALLARSRALDEQLMRQLRERLADHKIAVARLGTELQLWMERNYPGEPAVTREQAVAVAQTLVTIVASQLRGADPGRDDTEREAYEIDDRLAALPKEWHSRIAAAPRESSMAQGMEVSDQLAWMAIHALAHEAVVMAQA
jgi:hypothetical protein